MLINIMSDIVSNIVSKMKKLNSRDQLFFISTGKNAVSAALSLHPNRVNLEKYNALKTPHRWSRWGERVLVFETVRMLIHPVPGRTNDRIHISVLPFPIKDAFNFAAIRN